MQAWMANALVFGPAPQGFHLHLLWCSSAEGDVLTPSSPSCLRPWIQVINELRRLFLRQHCQTAPNLITFSSGDWAIRISWHMLSVCLSVCLSVWMLIRVAQITTAAHRYLQSLLFFGKMKWWWSSYKWTLIRNQKPGRRDLLYWLFSF